MHKLKWNFSFAETIRPFIQLLLALRYKEGERVIALGCLCVCCNPPLLRY